MSEPAYSVGQALTQALPEHVARVVSTALERPADRGLAAEAADLLTKARQNSATEIDQLLGALDPSVLLSSRLHELAVDHDSRAALDVTGLNRFHWTLGTGAHGASTDAGAVREYYRLCGRWVAAASWLPAFREVEDGLPLTLQLAPDAESLRRIFPMEVRFHWVARMVLHGAADLVAEGAIDSAATPWLTRAAIDEAFDHIAEWGQEWPPSVPPLGADARHLLEFVAAPRLPGRTFETLIHDHRMDSFPLVLVQGRPVPAAQRECLLGLDTAFVSALVGRHPDVGGDVFERIVSRCLAQVLGDARELPGPLAVRLSATDGGQVDLAVCDDEVLLLGECKAYSTQRAPHTAVNAFTDTAGSVVRQLAKRLDGARSGTPLATGCGSVSPADWADLYGVGVVLTTSGGAVWDANVVRPILSNRPDTAIIPLHQLLTVAAAFPSATDLVDYLRFRDQVLSLGPVLKDEVDLFMLYRSPIRDPIMSCLRRPAPGVAHVLAPFRVTDPSVAMDEPRPSDPDTWRQRLWDVLSTDLARS
ncbi:hypothetical protein SAMN05443575_1667 [Jatrophihabitans endophyticus]|uniref:Uncharacterized protein n=1 Tax=Jatrophihabitans endophyticus TaxID=1206085 RepID=A0A1M5HX13_9ACTN|nr:hypothetical protein [Jatrophihabitans endophyticus]SHG20412.1 hypothetical protein SAMN05443575_1667 [Jatrophihabitans endophyticus]